MKPVDAMSRSELEAEVSALRVAMADANPVDAADAFRLAWSLTRKESELLSVLCRGDGRTVSRDHLMDSLYGGLREPEQKILDVLVSRIRRKAKGDWIRPTYGIGYRLDADGLNACRAAIDGLKTTRLQDLGRRRA